MNATIQPTTDEEMRVRIAVACGWENVCCYESESPVGYNPSEAKHGTIPDYLHNLNACHDAEKAVILQHVDLYMRYLRELSRIVGGSLDAICATARQRCEAFLVTVDPSK